jgi:hypothetical protein
MGPLFVETLPVRKFHGVGPGAIPKFDLRRVPCPGDDLPP